MMTDPADAATCAACVRSRADGDGSCWSCFLVWDHARDRLVAALAERHGWPTRAARVAVGAILTAMAPVPDPDEADQRIAALDDGAILARRNVGRRILAQIRAAIPYRGTDPPTVAERLRRAEADLADLETRIVELQRSQDVVRAIIAALRPLVDD